MTSDGLDADLITWSKQASRCHLNHSECHLRMSEGTQSYTNARNKISSGNATARRTANPLRIVRKVVDGIEPMFVAGSL